MLLGAAPFSLAATLSLDAILRVNSNAVTGPPAVPNTASLRADLSGAGNVDWAYWATNSGTVLSTTLAPTNEKSGGSAISSITAVNGAGFRGSTTADTVGQYTWTGGLTTSTGTNQNLSGGLVFNSQIGTTTPPVSSVGVGFALDIAGNTAVDSYAVLYFGGFATTGKLTLTLAGATTIIDVSQLFEGIAPKSIVAYQVKFRPDLATDLLHVEYVSNTTSMNSHVGLDAVSVGTVSLIP